MTRVLIVDDDPTIRQILATLLGIEGFAVTTAPDGREALQQALTTKPDVVLSDLHMPHMDGCALLAALRAHPELKTVRFVFLAGTSDGDGDSAVQQAMAQADACLVKPIPRDVLLDTLRSLRS